MLKRNRLSRMMVRILNHGFSSLAAGNEIRLQFSVKPQVMGWTHSHPIMPVFIAVGIVRFVLGCIGALKRRTNERGPVRYLENAARRARVLSRAAVEPAENPDDGDDVGRELIAPPEKT